MGKNEKEELGREEFEILFKQVQEKLSAYLDALKKKSSEEILSGSVLEAQKLLNQISPIEGAYKNLTDAQNSLLNVLEAELETNTENVEEKNTELNENMTEKSEFRIPILKALIYLGGSAKVDDVNDFIKRDMKKKLTPKDKEQVNDNGTHRWVETVGFEKDAMVEEGLLNSDLNSGYWEIVQKGIDYLAKHGK